MRYCVHLSFLFGLFYAAYAGKQFRLGRSKHGNLGAPGDYNGEKLPEAQWFKQKLDHSDPSDQRTWKQRYFVNDTFFDFKKQGPVFLMIGGEGPADSRWMVKGAWIEYAKHFNAICINLEHRYYGKSHPTKDLSVKNLQYLSSYQALADAANFISAMNIKYEFKTGIKWVAFGGSYPGSLAAWLRMKYPHLVHVAVSSSGPLLAKLNFKEYFQIVVNALQEKTGGNECATELKEAHKQITEYMKNDPNKIEKEFKVCKPFETASENDIKTFYNSIADDFADLVQYNEDNRISADLTYKNLTINNVCNMLTESKTTPAYIKLAKFNDLVLAKSNETCMDYSYDNMLKELRNMTWNSDGARQWMYQTCTEFGFYQTSSSEVEVFGDHFTLDYFIQQCQDVFGKKFNMEFVEKATEWTNANYGALGIAVTNVVFVHGSVDPWHALGIVESTNKDAPAIYIKGTAHCANMYPPSENDSLELLEARVQIVHHLHNWLGIP